MRWLDITFCVGCNYQPRAAALAVTLREAYPEATVTLTPAGGGRFELSVDGLLLFSKLELGRHLLPGEALRLLDEHVVHERRPHGSPDRSQRPLQR